MYTMAEVAKMLGLPNSTFNYEVRIAERFPAPSHRQGKLTRLYYNADDVRKIKELAKSYNKGEF